MAQQLFDAGETATLSQDMTAVTYDVGLYDDSSDGLGDGAVYTDITTEPTGTSYESQLQASSTLTTDSNNNASLTLDKVVFNISDSTGVVDSVYVRDNQSGDLLFANSIGSQDLNSKDGSIEVNNIGFTLD